MSEILRLAYTCSVEEIEEAQSLLLRKQVGGGSRWRTLAVLISIALGLFTLLGYRIWTEVSPAWRPYVFAGIFAVFIFFFVRQRMSRRKPRDPSNLELSATELKLVGKNGEVAMPWSAFSECLESEKLFVLVDRPKSVLLALPKRAFPSESWQTWFRNRVDTRSSSPAEQARQASIPPNASARARPGALQVSFRLGFRDYIDRSMASWFTRGMILVVAVLVISTGIWSSREPHPAARYSNLQMFFYFDIPFLLVLAVMVVLIGAAHNWLSHKKHLVPTELVLSEDGIESTTCDGHTSLPWNAYRHHKETSSSFLLWSGQQWIMIPKRSFTSPGSLEQGRQLLRQNVKESQWFFG